MTEKATYAQNAPPPPLLPFFFCERDSGLVVGGKRVLKWKRDRGLVGKLSDEDSDS